MRRQYEYALDETRDSSANEAHNALMEKRGKDGWELVTVVVMAIDFGPIYRLYWKRDVPSDTYKL